MAGPGGALQARVDNIHAGAAARRELIDTEAAADKAHFPVRPEDLLALSAVLLGELLVQPRHSGGAGAGVGG